MSKIVMLEYKIMTLICKPNLNTLLHLFKRKRYNKETT